MDKVLLHLYSFREYASSAEVPEQVTQLGIAAGIDINYSHVPRAVKRLLGEELIFEVNAHLVGQPTSRRRRSYFLTEPGINAARSLLKNLANLSVVFIDKNGNRSSRTLGEINKMIEPSRSIFKLYKLLTPDNVFDSKALDRIKKSQGAQRQKQKIEFAQIINDFDRNQIKSKLYEPEQYPIIPEFKDRADDIKIIRNLIESKNSKVIIITGPKGIGKSVLLAEVLSNLAENKHSLKNQNVSKQQLNEFWLDVSGIKSKDEFINELDIIFGKNKKEEISNLNQKSQKKMVSEILPKIIKKLKNNSAVLILDNLEFTGFDLELISRDTFNSKTDLEESELHFDNQFRYFIQTLLKTIQEMDKVKSPKNLKIIITSRAEVLPTLNSIANSKIKKGLLEIHIVKGLPVEDVKEILGKRFSNEEIKTIYQHTDGNPLLVKTITEIEDSKLKELSTLSVDERVLSWVILAHERLEK